MELQRPDPDDLLKRVHEEEKKQARGRLKVFFGATAGVGKTYAMLQAAHEQKEDGVDLIVGVVETHKRRETEALLEGLDILPPRAVEHQGVKLREFDLDAALARRPALILIDELAHSNALGSRHTKRWQDVQELLSAGVNVYTTVNVQHLESLNDIVAQITGVIVRETVPDSILEQADDVELIDLPPDDLLQRLKEGKVYLPEQAKEALQNFFKKGNLIALRELALRRTADQVDAEMEVYRRDHAVVETWPAGERVMVCVNLKPRGARLVRAARRMAAGLRARWLAVYVQTSRHLRLSETERSQVIPILRMAERLGAETVTLTGDNVSQEILDYARKRNVTKIIVGKPIRPRWKEWFLGSVVGDLVRNSGEIDVYVITGEAEESKPSAPGVRRSVKTGLYLQGLGIVLLCSILDRLISPFLGEADLIMVYLMGVVIVATRYGRGPAILASFASVAAFDFLFIPPSFSLAITNKQYLVTFLCMLTVALLISGLMARIQRQAEAAREREHRTSVLYAMSRELTTRRFVENLTQVVARHIREVFESQIAVLLPGSSGALAPQPNPDASLEMDQKEIGVAQWAFKHNKMAGLGTDTLPNSGALHLPLIGTRGAVGVLAVRPSDPKRLLAPDQLHLLEAFADHIALAMERALLAKETQEVKILVETERIRGAVLSSISHDLRTPLATITGASSSLLKGKGPLEPSAQRELIQSIYDEGVRLDRLLKNLLDMTRLEAGAIQLKKEWHPVEEIVGAALTRLEKRLEGHTARTQLPPNLPLVFVDGALIEQTLINLLDNALKYAPPNSAIDLSAFATVDAIIVEIADQGSGFPPGDEERIFDKFYRAAPSKEGGVGLGLTICRGIIGAHGGRIWAENRPGGGAIFRFTLPLKDCPPRIEPEPEETPYSGA